MRLDFEVMAMATELSVANLFAWIVHWAQPDEPPAYVNI